MEKYEPLSLKYRPKTFSDVCGQEAIVTILKNIVMQKRYYPAFVFFGPRGTGKTTMSRVFARALNCDNLKDGEPCNECMSCKAILSDSASCYVEIDAASFGLVEHARKVNEMAMMKSLEGNFKVITFDESHEMSRQAWDALLKTVEEPPEGVVFIFCSTNANKIPETILSRCFSLPFMLIEKEKLGCYLEGICDKEGFKLEDKVISGVVGASGGSVRDAIVMLDQLGVLTNKDVKNTDLVKIGTVDPGMFIKFLQLCKDKNGNGALEEYKHWTGLIGVENFIKGLQVLLGDLLYEQWGLKELDKSKDIVLAEVEVFDRIKRLWQAIDESGKDTVRFEYLLMYYYLV